MPSELVEGHTSAGFDELSSHRLTAANAALHEYSPGLAG